MSGFCCTTRCFCRRTAYGSGTRLPIRKERPNCPPNGSGRCAGLLLPHPFLDEWGFAVRPDLPALALSLLAMLLLLVRPKGDRREPARPAVVPSPALAADSHGTL